MALTSTRLTAEEYFALPPTEQRTQLIDGEVVVAQGGGLDQYGQVSGFMNFEIGAQGQGGKYVLDGLD